MKLTLIALGAGAGCLLMASAAVAGPCSAEIDQLSKQLATTDAGMGPTGTNGAAAGTMTANPVSPSGTPQAPTTPATGAMNDASRNKATSPQDVQSQNSGQGTAADQAATTAGGNQTVSDSLARARTLAQSGDEAACLDEVNRARSALPAQP